jgi:hypothetical protein
MIYRIIKRLIPTSAVTISIIVFIITSLIVTYISRKHYDGDFMENVLVEAHGMLFDILVIGVLILFLNKLVERRIENRRYLEEIDDFRGWESEEAAYRNAGNLNRLKRNRYRGKLNLRQCYLGCVNLREYQDDNLLEYIKPYLEHSNLKGVNIAFADLQNVNLTNVKLQKAIFFEVDLRGSDLGFAKLEGADLQDVDLRNVRNLKLDQLSVVKSLYRTHLDLELMKLVGEKYPHLLERPVG